MPRAFGFWACFVFLLFFVQPRGLFSSEGLAEADAPAITPVGIPAIMLLVHRHLVDT
jgi:hypothetical protein